MDKAIRNIMNGRYQLTHQVNNCGETIVYLGRDTEKNTDVTIREFFCKKIMQRGENGEMTVKPGNEVLYKSLLADHEELCRYLMQLPEGFPVCSPVDVVIENNTVYSVEGYTEAERLSDYLARQKTVMSWPKLKRLIAPLIKLLSRLHADGIYHRGISTETLLITKDERLLLSDFCIPAARTADSEIDATLYFGYSAPEQYSSNSWQGSWSDVYSLAAVCYRILTGVIPLEWRQRGAVNALPSAIDIKSEIPQNVSDALSKALNVELSLRYRTIEEFWCDMLVQQGGGTVTYNLPVEIRTNEPEQPAESKRFNLSLNNTKMLATLIVITCATVFSLALAYKLVDIYFAPASAPAPAIVEVSEPPVVSSQPEEQKPLMPSMIGVNIETILLDPQCQEMFKFEIEWVFSENIPAGSVVMQQPAAYEEPNPDGQTYLWVSKGSELITMPEIVGLTLGDALRILDMSDIGYTIEFIEYDEALGAVETETVAKTSINAGETVHRSSDMVVVTVAQKTDESQLEKDTDGDGKINWEEYVFTMPPRKQVFWPPVEETEETK
ncbi:MAG: protein kinase [Oscillospiraceae bacterium]|nr:protein kinase [Oscillospiraceae bacterium]